jgi:hypothetical protein
MTLLLWHFSGQLGEYFEQEFSDQFGGVGSLWVRLGNAA